MNELSKIYILELKKLSALNDSEFMHIGNDYSSFEEELNVPLTEEEKKEIGIDFDLKNEAFLFADPIQPLNQIKKELDIYKGYSGSKNLGKTEKDLEKKMSPKQLELTKQGLVRLPIELLIIRLEEFEKMGELDPEAMGTARELQSKLINADSLFDILKNLYSLGVDFGRLQRIIELYEQIHNPRLKDNPMIIERFKGEILNSIFMAYSIVKTNPVVSNSRIDALQNKIKIRQSDIFDYLKPIDVGSNPETLDERDVLTEKKIEQRNEEKEPETIILDESKKHEIIQEEPTVVPGKRSTAFIFNHFLKSALILQDI